MLNKYIQILYPFNILIFLMVKISEEIRNIYGFVRNECINEAYFYLSTRNLMIPTIARFIVYKAVIASLVKKEIR